MEKDPIREQSLERSLPHSAEAEKAILGGIIIDNGLMSQAMEMLQTEDFYIPSHAKIFYAMTSLYMIGEEINPILIGEELKKENALQAVGGISTITNLTYGLPHSTNIAHYAKLVLDTSMLRKLIREANRIVHDALEQEDPPADILERAGKGVFQITLENTQRTFARIGPLIAKNLQKVEHIAQMGTAITGMATGFNDMDALTLGLQRQDLIIEAGRPSMGKTANAVQIAINGAKAGANVAFFSLEMSEEAIGNRIVCCEAKVDSIRFRSGHLTHEEWDRLHAAQTTLANAKLFIDDTAGITTLKIKAKCRRLVAEHGPLDLIVVDYIQLIGNEAGSRHYSREQEVSKISKELKGIAKELNAPVLALSQLSRAPESRADHRPMLSDLRESGSLEQDADLVIFIYREDKYKTAADHEATLTNIAELILAKQRNGPTGTAALRFDGPSGRFDNLYLDQ